MTDLRTNVAKGDDGHADWHNQAGRRLNRQVYVESGQGLQAGVDRAIASGRPLELEPGATYDLSAPLVVTNTRRFRLIGNGARLRATADMPMLLDLNGLADSRIEDLDLTTGAGVTVQSMVRYRWQQGVVRSSTRNRFAGIHVSGQYVNGWHIGDGSRQVDTSAWVNCTCDGGWSAGEGSLWQAGYLVGDGLHGNGMLLRFAECSTFRHRNHYRIDGFRYLHIVNCNGTLAECDVVSNAQRPVVLDGYRSEHSAMLFKADAGGATYAGRHSIRDCGFHTTLADMGSSRAVVDVNYGGWLKLENVTATGIPAGTKLVRSHDLRRTLYLKVEGADMEGIAPGEAFDLDAKTQSQVFGVQQINAQGGIVE